ncbi:methyltransferase family protein [Aneurinibacillus soli]|uniref:Bifunctional 3-demethylubiquinone-9 3-methyltransferase/ 2-octaprenyl-6-hydroxy phenol methylase n=1 Tax=Aneurinibacillus soli TaxID=1500254 RepID=A0A0U5ARS7_9BACL|nr:class I SAM-dependent methyltransferase [Aneurinibacillus soli]PYE61528.1 methyltransferase family protein [Aneurinibacillus soli]BAU26517.1 bifunctional 3-demethylubiquinone-9 3-methyltransferase/ 2-octaprenyl-6-hydroxy phenol methylase [Aneurinibacillus soli]
MENTNYVYAIPTTYESTKTKEYLSQYKDWFYVFTFSNDVATSVSDELIDRIHQTRADLIFPFLDELFQDRWDEITCMDIACNQGWFSTQLAVRGAKKVIGFDTRDEHLEMANVVKEIGGLNNITYVNQDLFELDESVAGQYDLTLFLGILYHLENPMGALRKVRSVTKNFCVIETQVARTSPELEILNGSDTTPKKGAGIGVFSADENHVQHGMSVVIVPTLPALYQMLYAAGFKRLYLSVPPGAMYEQYADFDRVVIFAQV